MKSATEKGRLFRRYFLVIGGGISLVLFLAIAIETPLSYRETLERVGEVQIAEARSASLRVEQFLRGVEGTLRESAGIPWSDPAFTEADIRAEHHRLMKLVPSLDALQVVDAEGRIKLAVSRRDLDKPAKPRFEDEALLRRAREAGTALGPVTFASGIEPVVAFAVRGAAPSADVLVADLNLRNVSDVVTQLRVGSAGRAFLVDAHDGMVTKPDTAKTILKPSEDAARQIAAARARLSPRGQVAAPFEARNADGVAVLTSAVALPQWGWLVVAEESLDAALAPVRATVYRLLGLMLAGVLLAMALSALLARRLSGPILALRRGAERIARGDLTSRIDVRTGDEVEALARDFNHMAAELEDHTTGLERKVEEKTAKLQEAMRARELFLAAASHDLRQPLYAIGILADALALKPLPDEAQLVLAKQRQAIGILRTLFDNLLDLSRFEAGEVRKALRDVSLREVLTPIAVEYEVLSHAKGLGWRCEMPDVWIRTDPELLRRLAGNLLSNAVRYTPSGTVSFDARVEGDEVAFTIADTGIGIAKEDQARVFQEFVQLDNPSRERDRGVGLGLSIVSKIDRLLEAKLALESAPGTGTRIGFRVPLAQPALEPATEVAHAEVSGLSGARVWVVEDDPMVRHALTTQLDEWAVDHDFAVTRAEILALREADGEWPDAVVLDDMLGRGERGLELAGWLAGHMPAGRIVLVTGNVEPSRAAALQASGFKVLRKPIASIVLAQVLSEALGSARSFPAGAPAG